MPYKNYEDMLANARRYYRAHPRTPEQKAKNNESVRRWRLRHPDKARDKDIRKRGYGIGLAEYKAMYAAQEGRCALCEVQLPTLHIDHDHQTGRIRGLLCSPCNRALGKLGDTADGLRRALAYIEGVPRK